MPRDIIWLDIDAFSQNVGLLNWGKTLCTLGITAEVYEPTKVMWKEIKVLIQFIEYLNLAQ